MFMRMDRFSVKGILILAETLVYERAWRRDPSLRSGGQSKIGARER
jgi:hypothetical protein